MSSLIPPPGLNSSGLKLWEKETNRGKRPYLYSSHFKAYQDYEDYREEQELAYYKDKLLEDVENPESIDPRFLRNLCKLLDRIDKLLDCIEEDLSGKADRSDLNY